MSLEDSLRAVDLTPLKRPEIFHSDREKTEACDMLLKFLLRERGLIAAFSAGYEKKRSLVRGYMNVRNPLPVPEEILAVQDRLFWTESVERGVVDASALTEIKEGVSLWQGDITRLAADGIVNAANKSLLGCFLAGHDCIDNVIHSAAGMQLRRDCARIISAQGREEECGEAKITRAYNLPSGYVLHTVGPMVGSAVTDAQRAQLRSCYNACLDLAEEAKLKSIAFCCISTGVFNFPREEAAEIAAGAVIGWKLKHRESRVKIVFNTFLPEDTKIYRNILGMIS